MKTYSKDEFPERAQDLKGKQEHFSVDVFTCDEDGLLNIGYYNFDTEKWDFHTDTLTDYYEEGIPPMYFVWIYPPDELLNGLKTKGNTALHRR